MIVVTMLVFMLLYAILNMHAGTSGRTKLAGGVVEEPYGRYSIEPTSPVSVESIRMITLRIKLDINIVQGKSTHLLQRRLACCPYVFASCVIKVNRVETRLFSVFQHVCFHC